jgi:BirA family biotin operon repressor/biotin-[acetyl-CoA-carboxylase] ligase
MVASLAVLHTIRKVSRLEPQIKWPNDVLINGKKVCGILIENGWQGTRLDYAVVGIGINVNFRPADYPEIAATATSLSGELGRETPLVDVVRQLLVKLDRLYPATTAVFKEWQANLATLGKPVKVTSGETAYEGVATSVDRDGGLVIRLPDGTSQRVEAGDVTLRGS